MQDGVTGRIPDMQTDQPTGAQDIGGTPSATMALVTGGMEAATAEADNRRVGRRIVQRRRITRRPSFRSSIDLERRST